MQINQTEIKKIEWDFETGQLTLHFKTHTMARFEQFKKIIDDFASTPLERHSFKNFERVMSVNIAMPEAMLHQVSDLEVNPIRGHFLNIEPAHNKFSVTFSSRMPFALVDIAD